jgi:hypothetical protein
MKTGKRNPNSRIRKQTSRKRLPKAAKLSRRPRKSR